MNKMNKNTMIMSVLLLIVVLIVVASYSMQTAKNNEKCTGTGSLATEDCETIHISSSVNSSSRSSLSSSNSSMSLDPNADAQVFAPAPNANVSSTFTIRGRARGPWFFEANLPIKIVDENNEELQATFFMTDENWMTTDFIEFETEVTVNVSEPTSAIVRIEKSNPSGLPERDETIEIPITIQPTTTTTSASASSENVTWDTYTDSEMRFVVEHPSQAQVESRENDGPYEYSTSIMYTGPTQTSQTELFDGVMFSVMKGTFDGSFDEFVQARIEDIQQVGSLTAGPSETTVNTYTATTFTAETLGMYTNYFIQTDANTVIAITTMSPDPTNQGYDQWIDQMLESFTLLD